MVPTEKLRQAVSDYKNGDAQAFTLLYQESDKYIYTCIYKVMQGNDNAADIISDIMQDTYVEVSKNIRQIENEECFFTVGWNDRNQKVLCISEKGQAGDEEYQEIKGVKHHFDDKEVIRDIFGMVS